MALTIRRSAERGEMRRDWLTAHFSFSFGDYYDPRLIGFGALRALNDYRLAPGAGFDAAWRSELEILSYVAEGALEHADSLGSASHVARGGLQRLTAGTGVEHCERNASAVDPLRFIHIWILPRARGAAPRYDQRRSAPAEMQNALCLLASEDGREGAVRLDRGVDLYVAALSPGSILSHPLGSDREAWLQVLEGRVVANAESLASGDGAGLRDEEVLRLEAAGPAEILLFDMARDG